MALTSKSVSLLVVAIFLAFAGLIAIQVTLLRTARDMEAQTFRTSVQSALANTVDRLETSEAATVAIMLAEEHTSDSLGVQVIARKFSGDISAGLKSPKGMPHWVNDSMLPTARWVGDTLYSIVPTTQRIKLGYFLPQSETDTIVLDTVLEAGDHRVVVLDGRTDKSDYFFRFRSGDSGSYVHHQIQADDSGPHLEQIFVDFETNSMEIGADSGRFRFVSEIVSRLTMGEGQPVIDRIDQERLDSTLANSLAEAGVPLTFAHGVHERAHDTMYFATNAAAVDNLSQSDYRVGLFPRDFGPSAADLVVYFPDRDIFLWQQIWPIGLATILLMGVMVGVFGYTIKTIIDQRRNATLMVDFVNNMTHEFKTPISTVALASEAILRDDVIEDHTRVAKFGQMIQSENRRMRLQAEKILQMAALEEKDHQLKTEPVEFHNVINEAVENVSLRVKSLHGQLTSDLTAKQSVILADPIHLSGIINNLLDNAVKYSKESPIINVHSSVIGRHLVLKVSDRGIGLKAEDRKRVFDKYYRVSSGNVHNVKGFGLGLSYVKLMVAAHGGDISVDSTPGRGATFRVSLPLHSPDKTEVSDVS